MVLSAPASTAYSFLTGTFTNAYTYDAASNRTGYTAPDSSTNTYSYDTLNRLTTLANSWAGSFGFSYDSLSRRTQMTRPNSITTNYTYDSLSRLLTVLHQAGGSTIDGASYTLDSAGNRTVKVDQHASVTSDYTYDALYELTQATQGGTTTESYSYDPVGNRTASLGVSSYTTNSSNEMTANSNASYTYDYNGNTTSKTASSATTNYTWDYENRLASVTLPSSGGTVTFKYDPFGRRIQKVFTTGTTTTTNYLYDGENDIEELNASGTILARYTQGQNIDEPLAESRSSTTSFYEADGLGSVTSLTNGSGTIANSYTYDSFGNLTASSGSITNPFQYTSRDFEPETGLRYYRARYYDSTTGRFMSEDPIKFLGGIDFYRYVSNSSIQRSDPSGLNDVNWSKLWGDAKGTWGTVKGWSDNVTCFAKCAWGNATATSTGTGLARASNEQPVFTPDDLNNQTANPDAPGAPSALLGARAFKMAACGAGLADCFQCFTSVAIPLGIAPH